MFNFQIFYTQHLNKKTVKINPKWNEVFGRKHSPWMSYHLFKIRLTPILLPNFPPIIQLYLKIFCVDGDGIFCGRLGHGRY